MECYGLNKNIQIWGVTYRAFYLKVSGAIYNRYEKLFPWVYPSVSLDYDTLSEAINSVFKH
jgi:hypothetical protein